MVRPHSSSAGCWREAALAEVLVAGNRDMDEAGAWKMANMTSLLMHALMDNW